MAKNVDYNLPAGALDRLSTKTIVTRGDKLVLLRTLSERAGSVVQAGTNRATLAAIEADVRAAHRKPAHKDNAPVGPEAPSKTVIRAEAGGSSIASSPLERKIELGSYVVTLKAETHTVNAYAGEQLLHCMLPDEARRIAAVLNELADDVEQDTHVRTVTSAMLADQV